MGMSVGWAVQKDIDSQDIDSRAALTRAWELGINHWDTADSYGNGHSESIIGSIWETIPRRDIFLATKVGWRMGPHNHYYHPGQMRHQFESSLTNLNTDVIDLLYLHHCDFGASDEYFDDANELVHRLREEGKIRYIGLSDWSNENIMKFADRVNPDVLQPYRNVMDDTYVTSGLKRWVDTNHVGVCFFSPLKHGLLTGKYTTVVSFTEGDWRLNVKDFQNPAIIEQMRKNRLKLEAYFAHHPHPVLHGVIDSLLTDAATGCVLLGQRNVQQVEAAATLGTSLSVEDSNWVKSLFQRK